MKQIKCSHCQLSFGEEVMIKDGDLYFCCKGCQGVYHLLSDENLNDFYDRVGENRLTPAKAVNENLEKFDLEGVKKKYIKERDGFYEISLIIEGIHCSACVWLNEKVLHKTEGIVGAEINYTTNKAKIIWDNDTIKLSKIIQTIQSIGYNAYPYDPTQQEEKSNKIRTEYYSRLLVGVFATMNIMWIAVAQYAGYFSGIRADMKNVLNIAEFILATPTLFYTGWVYFRGAYFGLKNRFINMDFLVATGASLAYGYSIYAMIYQVGEVYFDSVTMIITFVFAGKYLEILSKKRAVDSMDFIVSSIPSEIAVIKNGKKTMVEVSEVKIGDIIEIIAGEKIVIDGKIVEGQGSFDQSSLTGESIPIFKKVGDIILSGTNSVDSVIKYEATKEFNSSTLTKIITILEDSLSKKPKIEEIANQVSGYFSLIILTIAIFTFFGWYLNHNFETAIIVAISVIVIACPCALGLATPVSTLVGIGEGIKNGILFKQSSSLETISKTDVVVFDKTGTITIGKPKVVNFKIVKEFDMNLLYSLTQNSIHPISQAITNHLKSFGKNQTYKLNEIKNISARGLKANLTKEHSPQILLGGNLEFMRENGINFSYKSDNSIFIFAIDNEVVCVVELKDELKNSAEKTISELKKLGLELVILSGDNQKVVEKIAKEVGIDDFHHSLLPIDKANFIDQLHKKNKKVIMVGDGINDSIALAKSDIAVAMGSGADIAIDVSDVVLLNDKIENLLLAVQLSKKVYKTIKQNIAFSLFYNLITIPLAVMGFVIPLISALSMSFSSLVVVLNAMRIKR